MLVQIKLFLLLFVRKLEEIIHSIVARWVTKHLISDFQELPIWKMLSWEYIKNLTLSQVTGYLIIGSFTLITFPLGIWLHSYEAGIFYPLSGIFNYAISLIAIPLTLYGFNKTVKEISFNNQTILGLIIIEISTVFCCLGWYLIYRGNN